MVRLGLSALVALVLSSCAHPMKSDEAQIYEAILFDQQFTTELGDTEAVMVVSELAQADVLVHGAVATFATLGANQSTVEALNRASLKPGRLPAELESHSRLVVVSDPEPRSPAQPRLQVDQAFAQRYPGHQGFVRFSPIGFSVQRTEAVVAAVLECGGLCSHGDMFVLRRNEGRWKITNRRTPWIS